MHERTTAHKLNCGFFIPESFSFRNFSILAERTQSVFPQLKPVRETLSLLVPRNAINICLY
jgi:hypothetical protein